MKKRNLIIVFGVLFIAIVITYQMISKPTQPSKLNPVVNQYKDPVTGETITTQQGKSVEKDTTNSNEPVYSGFGVLLDKGMTLDQVKASQRALAKYKPFANSNVILSIDPTSVQVIQSDDVNQDWSYNATLVTKDGVKFDLSILTLDLQTVDVTIKNQNSSTIIYDSGQINSDPDSGED